MDVTLNMVALISLCVFFTVNQEANYSGVPVRVSAGCEQARQTGGESLHLRSLSLINLQIVIITSLDQIQSLGRTFLKLKQIDASFG